MSIAPMSGTAQMSGLVVAVWALCAVVLGAGATSAPAVVQTQTISVWDSVDIPIYAAPISYVLCPSADCVGANAALINSVTTAHSVGSGGFHMQSSAARSGPVETIKEHGVSSWKVCHKTGRPRSTGAGKGRAAASVLDADGCQAIRGRREETVSKIGKHLRTFGPHSGPRSGTDSDSALFDRGSRRHLLQFDPVAYVALAIAVAALYEVESLKSAFYSFQDQTLQAEKQIQAGVDALANQLVQVTRNLIITMGLAAVSAGNTALEFAETRKQLEFYPQLAAALAIDVAMNVSITSGRPLVIPVTYSSSAPKKIEIHHYLGIVKQGWFPLANISQACGFPGYLIADIFEEYFPWAVSSYFATVYWVQPWVPVDAANTLKQCTTAPGANTFDYGCTSTGTGAPYSYASSTAPWQVALFMSNDAILRQATPISVHSSRENFLNQWNIPANSYFDPSDYDQNQCTRPQAEIWLPAANRPTSTSSLSCISSAVWQNEYASQCGPKQVFLSGKNIVPPDQPVQGAIQPPAYLGQITQLPQQGVLFRTVGIAPELTRVYHLVRNQVQYYDTSSGLSQSPPFYDEWVTEDGFSVPEELISQYLAMGLTRGSTLESLASIPSNIYTLNRDPARPCASPACVQNRENYAFDTATGVYGDPFVTVLIAPAVNPIPCDGRYDCNSVKHGSTGSPTACVSDVCCSIQGYVCFVTISGNGTISFAAEIGGFSVQTALNTTALINFLNQDAGNGRINYDSLLQVVQNADNLTAIINALHGFSAGGSLGDFISEAVNGAAAAAVAVANAAENAAKNIFFGGLGAFDTLLAWLPMLLVFGVIVAGACFLMPFLKDLNERGGHVLGGHGGKFDRVASAEQDASSERYI